MVLAEHVMNTAWVPLDGACIEMLALESELRAQGIEVVFEPFRPGEGGSFTRTIDQPIRMLVPGSELERAREVAAALASESGDE